MFNLHSSRKNKTITKPQTRKQTANAYLLSCEYTIKIERTDHHHQQQQKQNLPDLFNFWARKSQNVLLHPIGQSSHGTAKIQGEEEIYSNSRWEEQHVHRRVTGTV